MTFELASVQAVLRSVTPRSERHGEDDRPAVSLGFLITTANTILDRLSPTLRKTLYEAVPDQAVIEGVEETTPLLRTRGIDVIHFNGACEGWTLNIDHGIDELSAIVCGGCKVDKFKVAPKEGGTVDLFFRVGTSDVDADSLGKLAYQLGSEVTLTLTAPVPQEPAIDGSVGAFQADHPDQHELLGDRPDDDDDAPLNTAGDEAAPAKSKRGKKVDATDAFVAAHGEAGAVLQ